LIIPPCKFRKFEKLDYHAISFLFLSFCSHALLSILNNGVFLIDADSCRAMALTINKSPKISHDPIPFIEHKEMGHR
jgi:hypothetical protein